MCQHTRRPKVFCLLDSCSEQQCCACTICIKNQHNHSGKESLISQKDLNSLLKQFELPLHIKQQRKSITIKTYKLLTTLKTDLNNKLQDLVADLMSKIKYPYLYHFHLLQTFRNIRDKNYHKLNPQHLKLFVKTASSLKPIQFVKLEQQYYTLHQQTTEIFLSNLQKKIKLIEEALTLTLSPEIMQLHEDYLKEIENQRKNNKKQKQPEKDYKNKVINKTSLEHPPKLNKLDTDFLTPIKIQNAKEVSIESLSFRGSQIDPDLLSKKSDWGDDSRLFLKESLEILGKLPRYNTPQLSKHSSNIQKTRNQQIFNYQKNIHETQPTKESHPILYTQTLSRSQYHSTNSKKEEQTNILIKVTDPKSNRQSSSSSCHQKEPLNLMTESIQIKSQTKQPKTDFSRRQSFNGQMHTYVYQRQESIKRRLTQLKKELNINQPRKSKPITNYHKVEAQEIKIENKEIENNNKNKNKDVPYHISPPKHLRYHSDSNHINDKKDRKSPKKHLEVSILDSITPNKHSQLAQNQSYSKRMSPKKQHNVSLNKQFLKQPQEHLKKTDLVLLELGNLTKQIPIVTPRDSPRKAKLQKPNKKDLTYQEQISASHLFLLKIQQLKNKQQLLNFLEKYIEKYQTNLTAIQHLSYLYLELGRNKECLSLSNDYLEKLDQMKINEKIKLNLIINKSAALNLLGRYSETISFLQPKLQLIQHQKLHKNNGDAHFNLGDIDTAIYHYEKATRMNANYDQAFYNLSVILYLQESFFNALMNIEKAIRFQPKNPLYLELLAAIKQRINRNPFQ